MDSMSNQDIEVIVYTLGAQTCTARALNSLDPLIGAYHQLNAES